MKRLEICDVLGDDSCLVPDELFENDAVVTIENGFIRVADDNQCLLIRDTIATLALVPVDDKKPFDCAGDCTQRCYECDTQAKVIKGED